MQWILRAPPARVTEMYWPREGTSTRSPGFSPESRSIIAPWPAKMPRMGKVAAEVKQSGVEQALEPMSAADRKAVHDTVAEIDGVLSRSEGEDPYRYVVIAPEA